MEVRCCYHCQSWAHLRIDSAETENAVFFLRVPPTNHASHAVHQCCTPTMTALACPRARFGGSVEVPAGRHGARVSWTIRHAGWADLASDTSWAPREPTSRVPAPEEVMVAVGTCATVARVSEGEACTL